MNTREIVKSAQQAKVDLYLENGKLKYKAKKNALNQVLKTKIGENKQAIINYLQQQLDNESADTSSAQSDVQKYKAAYAQQRLWFIDQMEARQSLYNIVLSYRLVGELNEQALQRSFEMLINRHQAIRTTLLAQQGHVYQKIQSDYQFIYTIINLSTLLLPELESEIDNITQKETNKPFDLTQDVLLRVSVIKLSNNKYQLLIVLHHIAFDGVSIEILLKELSSLYNAYQKNELIKLEPLPVQYIDYSQWQHDWFEGAVFHQQLNYWKVQLEGLAQVHNLPLDKPRAPQQSYCGCAYSATLSTELVERIDIFCRQQKITLYIFLHTMFTILLSRYSGEQDIVVGMPVAGRIHKNIENIIGFFVNTLVLRTDLGKDPTLAMLLTRNKKIILEAFDHQYIPFEVLVEHLNPERNLSYNPMFQVLFSLQNKGVRKPHFDNISIDIMERSYKISKFDLSLYAEQNAESIELYWEYASDLFETSTIIRLCDNFITLITHAITYVNNKISTIPILEKTQRQHLLYSWNNTKKPLEKNICIHELFERQVEKTPEDVAVIEGEKNYTYRELNNRSNYLSRNLIRSGVVPSDKVAIYVERSIDLLVCLLGVLKAGAAYIPLDPSYPEQRTCYILNNASVRIVVTQVQLKEIFAASPINLVCLEDIFSQFNHTINNENVLTQSLGLSSSDLSYVIYTSGSTGNPKGVMIEHRNAVAFLLWAQSIYSKKELKNVLASTSICFDLSIFEMFLPVITGGCVVIVKNILQLIDKNTLDISLINTVPSAIEALLESIPIPKSVITVNVAGEPLRANLVDSIYQSGHVCHVYNLYGPSEYTTYTTYFSLERNDTRSPLIGTPISNTQVYILGTHLEPVPVGVTGELYIAGQGLSRGYLNNSKLTSEVYIPNPFNQSNESRMYKTGDYARWTSDGKIDYMGRLDGQTKINGFRIETAEIESIVFKSGLTKDNTVIVRNNTQYGNSLVAYVVPAESKKLLSNNDYINQLKQYLFQQLPKHLVPKAFVRLDNLPLTLNGKIDKNRLPKHEDSSFLHQDYHGPKNAIQNQLISIWKTVLNLEKVSITDNFFDLGGHSLLVVTLRKKIIEQLDVTISLTDLFVYPTVQSVSEFISEQHTQNHCIKTQKSNEHITYFSDAIAIIGMSGRFPGANNIEQYWHNIISGKDALETISDDELIASGVALELINDASYVKARMSFEGRDLFDNAFFQIPENIASITDPQNRLLLECSLHALESAGYPEETANTKIGVYVGKSNNSAWVSEVVAVTGQENPAEQLSFHIQNDRDFLAQHISYHLNLSGPSVNVGTACSTSLVAVQEACSQLRLGTCDIALAGGACVTNRGLIGYQYQPRFISSKDGYCRPFDKKANGTIAGNGVGVVVLKRLSDAKRDRDNIVAVIRGWSVNNDASSKIGFTAPGVKGQSEVISQAYQMANFDADTVQYVETHGTATPLGDSIEYRALAEAFSYSTSKIQKKRQCVLGAVKANIGHLDAAAGIAGLIKTAQALQKKLIPPSANFNTLNPELDFDHSRFQISTQLRQWDAIKAIPRRAGVSSFGIGGTNVHLAMEESEQPLPCSAHSESDLLLILSAKTKNALKHARNNLVSYLRDNPLINMADVVYTLQVGRSNHAYRCYCIASSPQKMIEQLLLLNVEQITSRIDSDGISSDKSVLLIFDGQALKLNQRWFDFFKHNDIYQAALNECLEQCCEKYQDSVRTDILSLSKPSNNNTASIVFVLATFCVEYALGKFWLSIHTGSYTLTGIGFGKLVCACLAGVFTPASALALIESIFNDNHVQYLENHTLSTPNITIIDAVNARPILDTDLVNNHYWISNSTALLNNTVDISSQLMEMADIPKIKVGQCRIFEINEQTDTNNFNNEKNSLLRIIGQLWLRGFSISWRSLYTDRLHGRIPLPVYPFERKPFKLMNMQLTSKKQQLKALSKHEIQEQVSQIWEEIFGMDDLEKDDNFFQIGGDSLQALRVVNSLEKQWNLSITVEDMYLGATIEVISEKIFELEHNRSTG